MLKLLIAAAALAFAPAAAQAEQGGANANPNARVCRALQVVGSRLGARRVCKTQAEWDEEDRMMRGLVRDSQNRHLTSTVDEVTGRPNGSGIGGPR